MAKELESEETCRYSIQKTPSLERSTQRSGRKPAVARRSSSVLLVIIIVKVYIIIYYVVYIYVMCMIV